MAHIKEADVREDVDLEEISDAARRVAAARLDDPETIADVVQETLARVMEARRPLEGQAKLAYAIVVARNLVTDIARNAERFRNSGHRLIDLRHPERPEDVILRQEERQALEQALNRVPAPDRKAFIEHEVQEVGTAQLARQMESTPGGVATRLARTRAKLRVEYLLALRGISLPTPTCKRVLIALSAGDARRQAALDAGRHLLECGTCSSLSPALLERRRALAGLLPVAFLARWGTGFKSWLGTTAGKVVSGTAVAGAGAAVVVLTMGGGGPQTKPPSMPIVTVSGHHPVAPGDSGSLERYVGERVEADDAVVRRVPSDEGFWVASGDQTVLWIVLKSNGESRVHIEPGDSVAFSGILTRNPPGFAAAQGLEGDAAGRLRAQGYHIDVRADEIRIISK